MSSSNRKMAKFDLLTLNLSILNRFETEHHATDAKLLALQRYMTDDDNDDGERSMVVDVLLKNVHFHDLKKDKHVYLLRTREYVEEYKQMLKTPFDKTCALSRDKFTRKDHIENRLRTIILDVIMRYRWFDIKLTPQTISSTKDGNTTTSTSTTTTNCTACDNACQNGFDIDENNKKTCLNCSREINTIETGHTHHDYNRVNIVSKFVHNRVLHLQECIKQFQGKQNCKIPENVYVDLNRKFETYRLLIDSDNYHARYSKITPQHISMFLKELGYVKHYKNVNAIYYILTNKRMADISAIEQKLVEDFKELVCLYNSLHTKDKPEELERKNFMNVHYLLFQLLRRHGYPCRIDDFSMLKTIDRKIFHDKICGNLFEKLGWNFTPIF